MNLKIFGDTWTVTVLEKKEFKKQFPRCIGTTDTSKKTIHLMEGEVTQELVAHEISHAYYSYLCISSCSMKQEDMEEVLCDFVGRYGELIIKQTNTLLKKLK